MSKTIPNNLMITDVSITNYHRVYATESMTGVVNRRDTGIQWFKGSITLQAYTYENVRLLNGFLASLKGRLYAFKLPLGGAYINPNLSTNPTVSNDLSAGSNVIKLFHTSTDITMGSVFTIANETKLYTLLDSVEGSGTYDITPALKRPHSKLEEVNFINPVITAILNGDETTIAHDGNGMIARATLTWTEHLT